MPITTALRKQHDAQWTAAISHKFVADLWKGTIPDAAMGVYLAQDYLFVDAFVALMGAAVSHSDSPSARMKIARQLGFITNAEDGYFQRALERLQQNHQPAKPLAPTLGFIELMDAARADYASALTVLLVAEWLYLDWATVGRENAQTPADWLHAEWIELHRGEAFEVWVQLLKDELDRVAEQGGAQTRARIEEMFGRAVALELAFFQATYP